MTSTEGLPVAGRKPSALQIAAARLVITADRKLGDKTPEWIERLAQGLPLRRRP